MGNLEKESGWGDGDLSGNPSLSGWDLSRGLRKILIHEEETFSVRGIARAKAWQCRGWQSVRQERRELVANWWDKDWQGAMCLNCAENQSTSLPSSSFSRRVPSIS